MQSKQKPKKPNFRAWRPTSEDEKIVRALIQKLGIGHSQIVRLAIRKLAEHEGLRAA